MEYNRTENARKENSGTGRLPKIPRTAEETAKILATRGGPRSLCAPLFVRKTRFHRNKNGNSTRTLISCGVGGYVVRGPAAREYLPEAYKDAEECILVFSNFDFTDGSDKSGNPTFDADRIYTYDRKYWRVVDVLRWKNEGLCRAVAVRAESFWEEERRERLAAEAAEGAGG